MNSHTPKTIVVTGATGFTGAFVVRDLRAGFPGATIRCLVRKTSAVNGLGPYGVELAIGDLRDGASLRRAFEGADALVNVASLGFDWVDPLFEAVRASRLRRGVFVGTTAMLTALPVRSKAVRERGEQLARTSGLAWTIVRPTMIYGTPNDRNVARLIRFVLASPIIPVVAPEAMQQPVHVEDVASAIVATLRHNATTGRAYNIAGGTVLTLEEMVKTVADIAGVKRLIVRVPTAPTRAAVRVMERLLPRPLLKAEQIDRLHENKSFDSSEARHDFGFDPRSFAEGVRAEIALMRKVRTV